MNMIDNPTRTIKSPLILDSETILKIIKSVGINTFMDDSINSIESHLKATNKQFERKSRVGFSPSLKSVIECMPSREIASQICFKIVNFHDCNYKDNIPTVMSTTLLLNESTGQIEIIADSTLLTYIRTGASTAIATKYLIDNPKSFGFIGTGAQAQACLHSFSRIFNLKKIYIWDQDHETMSKFIRTMSKLIQSPIKIAHPKNFLDEVDVVTTTTYGNEIIIKDEWVNKKLYINAIGADTPGKQEIDTFLLIKSKIITDFMQQAILEGELNNPIKLGILTENHIFAEINEIINQLKYISPEYTGTVIFDSTGDPIEDLAILKLIKYYSRQYEVDKGKFFSFSPRNSRDPYEIFAN